MVLRVPDTHPAEGMASFDELMVKPFKPAPHGTEVLPFLPLSSIHRPARRPLAAVIGSGLRASAERASRRAGRKRSQPEFLAHPRDPDY